MPKCEDCAYCTWDGETGDYGATLYDSWYCKMLPEVSEDETYPYENIDCDYFLKDFWKSEFAEEVNGSDESLNMAYAKWKEKYCVQGGVHYV